MKKSRPTSPAPRLSHIDASGKAAMVDVSPKAITQRRAVAEAFVRVSPALAKAIRANTLAKGDLLEVARLAGIQAAKRTADLIPLCHPLPLDHVEVSCELRASRVAIRAEALCHAKTGVEMEALTAAAVAALTVIDMGKAIDKGMVIEGLRVLEKSGGRSSHYVAPRRRALP